MKRIIILTLCVSILLPCSFTISAQTDDPWVNLIGGTVQAGIAIGQKFKTAKNEKKIEEIRRKGDDPFADCYYVKNNGSLALDENCCQMVRENLAKEESEKREQARIELENKKIESEKQLQQLRESNSPYADCYSINENGDLVLNEYCADVKNLSLMMYVDLGLPSGTLWGSTSLIGSYTYDAAIEIYGHLYGLQLPSEAQFEELRDKCTWSWKEGYYQVIGPNGNCIYLLARGSYTCDSEYINGGYYWSSTLYDTYNVYQLFYNPGSDAYIGPSSRCRSHSVCLVKSQAESVNHNETHRAVPLPQSYVDLGLPSGTLWKNSNEGGDNAHYAYDEAVRKFGSRLPTKAQFEELKDKCTWTWMGNGYKVTGPNGNSITLPAAGIRVYTGEVVDLGKNGSYWSSTPYDSEFAWNLIFNSEGMGVDFYYRSLEQSGESVRLVM